MTSEDITLPVGKYDFIWATHDRGVMRPGAAHDPDSPPLVIMIHGFPGDSKSYGDVFSELSARFIRGGYHTLRFDLRGCGQSNKAARFFTLKSAHEDGIAVLRWAQKLGYRNIYLVAEGLGALVAVTTLTDALRPLIRGMIFLWPVLDQRRSWLADLLPGAAAAEKAGCDHITVADAESGAETHLGLPFLHEVAHYDLIPLLQRVTMPVMVHHGLADHKVPTEQLDILRTRAGTDRLEFVTYDGGGHGLKDPLHRQRLLAECADFVRKIR